VWLADIGVAKYCCIIDACPAGQVEHVEDLEEVVIVAHVHLQARGVPVL
jgi:hypothetical protein